jgi:cellulose synthase operon protein C
VLLEEQAFPFEEKAIKLHELNTARAKEGIYDEWVQKSFTALAQLNPGRYAKVEISEQQVDSIR